MKDRRDFMDEDAIRERMGLAAPRVGPSSAKARSAEASSAEPPAAEPDSVPERATRRTTGTGDDLPSAGTEIHDAEPRDAVETRGGDVRPQRSTEEHGSGLVEAPGVNEAHQRVGGPGPDYPESHSEPPAHPDRDPGGDTESAHAASEAHGATRDHDAVAAAEAGHAMGHTDLGAGRQPVASVAGHGAIAHAGADAHAATDAGHADAHGEPRLGPIDTAAWGLSLLGVAIGAGIAFLFYLSTV